MSTLPQLNIRYPFDPTGRDRGNLVVAEKHTLPPVNNRMIVPREGAFFAESLIVRQGHRVLQKNVDYELAGLYHDATVEVGKDVNIIIYISNLDITGDIEISYQVIGGRFTGTFEMIQQYVNVLLVDPRKVHWDDILNKPELYAPKEHFHDINDVYGLNHLIPKLEEIRQALLRIRSKEFKKVYDRVLQIKLEMDTAAANMRETIQNALREVADASALVKLLRQQLATAVNRITALENDRTLHDEIQKLKSKDRELAASIQNINTNITNILEELGHKAKVVHNNNVNFFNGTGNTPKDNATNTNGFITGNLTPAELTQLGIPGKVGTKAFTGSNVVNAGKLTTQMLHMGPGEHYIRSTDNSVNPPVKTTEKVLTSYNFLNDKEVQDLFDVTIADVKTDMAFVDAENGNDDNDGTYERPFRTVLRAIRKVNRANRPALIRIKEGQTHTVPTDRNQVVSLSPYMAFSPYGSRTNQAIGYTKTNPPYETRIWPGFSRNNTSIPETVLNFTYNGDTTYSFFTNYIYETRIDFFDVKVKVTAPNTTTDNLFTLIHGGNKRRVGLANVVLDLPHTNIALADKAHEWTHLELSINTRNDNLSQWYLGDGRLIRYSSDGIWSGGRKSYDGVSLYVKYPHRYTQAWIDKLLPGLTSGVVGWDSGMFTNLRPESKTLPKEYIPLSSANRNRLQMREDGLYLGVEAKPDYSNLYVDTVRGSDGNPGTRERPLKTLYKAIMIDTTGSHRTIRLMEGQEHVLNQPVTLYGGSLYFKPYGPRFDAQPERVGDVKEAQLDAYNLNTVIAFRPETVQSGQVAYIVSTLFDIEEDTNIIITGVQIKKYTHKFVEQAIRGQNAPDGRPYRISSYMGLDKYHGSSLAINARNTSLSFINTTNLRPTDGELYNQLVNTNALVTGHYVYNNGNGKVTLEQLRGNQISGDGVLLYSPGTGYNLVLDGNIDRAKLRKYLANVPKNATGLNVINLSFGLEKYLPYREVFDTYHGIKFHNARNWQDCYIGNTDTNTKYTTAGLYYEWDGQYFRFDKPVRNNRGQTLGVSAEAGNLLQVRPDGAYYGINPPPDVSNLYVSSSAGNDNNPGTKERPLRTLDAALRKIPEGVHSRVKLKARESFELPWEYVRNNMVTIEAYDVGADFEYNANTPYFRPYNAADYPRPIINVRKKVDGIYVRRARVRCEMGIGLTGIHIKVHDAMPSNIPNTVTHSVTNVCFSAKPNINVNGCIIEQVSKAPATHRLGWRAEGVVSAMMVDFQCCKFIGFDRQSVYQSKLTDQVPASIKLYDFNGTTLDGLGIRPNKTNLAPMETMRRAITLHNLATGIGWNETTKQIYGPTCNWDIFHYSADVI